MTLKRIVSLFVIALLCLLALPSLAQDEPDAAPAATVDAPIVQNITAEEGSTVNVTPKDTADGDSSDDPLNYVIVVVAGVVIVAVLIFGGMIVGYVSKLVPPETANSIYQSGVRMGLQLALNNAAQTSTPYDNEFFEGLAQMRGYEVIKLANGRYEVNTPTATQGKGWREAVDPFGYEARRTPPPEPPLTSG